jgi:hypothetical protein
MYGNDSGLMLSSFNVELTPSHMIDLETITLQLKDMEIVSSL